MIFTLELTFAGLQALKPFVFTVFVTDTSASLEPRSARSTTTDSAGFPKLAALWARHYISYRWADSWSAD